MSSADDTMSAGGSPLETEPVRAASSAQMPAGLRVTRLAVAVSQLTTDGGAPPLSPQEIVLEQEEVEVRRLRPPQHTPAAACQHADMWAPWPWKVAGRCSGAAAADDVALDHARAGSGGRG
jgi:hypothetical protein